MLATAVVGAAHGQAQTLPDAGDDALAMVRPPAPNGVSTALPQPLPPSLARRVRQMFAYQQRRDIRAALRATARLDDGSPLGSAMLGHVLADRYLGPDSRPDADQLQSWLNRWPDLPDAPAIRRLMLSRLPSGAKPPPPSAVTDAANTPPPPPLDNGESDPEAWEGPALRRNADLDRTMAVFARARGEAGVLHLLHRTSGLTPLYSAALRGEAARVLFIENRDPEALSIGTGALHGCGADSAACAEAALPAYAAGLAAWRMQRITLAGALFGSGWKAALTTPELRSACAYWAARADQRLGNGAASIGWLQRAAAAPETFYGALAQQSLRRHAADGGERAALGEADMEAVSATGAGLRAFALLQVGQDDRAAAELNLLWPQARESRPLARAIVLVADAAGLTDTASVFATLLPPSDPAARTLPRLKVPPLHPAGGFRIDPALLYAIARTESNFDASLVSGTGACGILQIMPQTAREVVGHAVGEALYDPATNLDLGQRYIALLSEQDGIGDNLLHLLASYNAGPGGFARWGPAIHDNGDPLLFMEAIPVAETRAYLRRVLSATWLYAQRLHLPAPTLDDLAADRWPRYRGHEANATLH
jgi:soluble lytic murein transglycosylase-like protein